MNSLAKIEEQETELEKSIKTWIWKTTTHSSTRKTDITRDKKRAVGGFFGFCNKEPNKVTMSDVQEWHQHLLDRNLSENYIYATLAHLSSYYEWLKNIPEFSGFLITNPVRAILPKPPKQYNSAKAKSLTDEELTKLWLFVEDRARDDKNKVAVRDYAIFRLFAATGMRREEVINLGADDIKIEEEEIHINTRVKGGDYEWRSFSDREVRDAIERYLRICKRKSLIGKNGKALWIRFDNAAETAQQIKDAERPSDDEPRLSSHAFDKQIKSYAKKAGIGHFHIHQFRHTFARIIADDTGSIHAAQEALGHKNLATTRIYVDKIRFKKDTYSQNVSNRIKRPAEDINDAE